MKRRAKYLLNVQPLEGRTLLSTTDPITPFIYGDSYIPGRTDTDVYRAILDSQSAASIAARASAPSTGLGTTTVLATPGADPGDPGPLSISHAEYTFGDSAFTPTGPGFPDPWPVELTASVTYPTDLSGGPHPLIVFVHGRHLWSVSGQWPPTDPSDSIPSYHGYDYIADNLASHGNFVVSISANGINALDNSSPDLGALARAELIQRHLDIWRDIDTTGIVAPFGTSPFGTQFVGKVDLQNIGLMGHSRGGEGVVEEYLYNQGLGSPYGIKAVFALAPVDFSREVINGVPLGVMLPYNDGDVSDLQGVHFYDDARYNVPGDQAPKHTVYVIGANHNFFNTIWTPGLYGPGAFDDGVGPPDSRLSPEQERGVGEAYIAAFFRAYIDRANQFFPYLTGDAPPPPSALIGPDQVFASYHPADDPSARLDVNRLLDPSNLAVNTPGGAATQEGLSPYAAVGGEPPEAPYVLFGFSTPQEPHTVQSFLAPDRRGLSQLVLGWDAPGASYRNDLPAGSRDVSRYPVLRFRAGLNFADPRNAFGEAQDFSVVLTDGSGHTARTRVSDWSRALFYPPSFGFPTPKLFLNDVRIPLSAFSGVDLTDVRSIQFDFDLRPSGGVVLTDLMFANASLGMAVIGTTPEVGSVVVGAAPPSDFVVRFSDPYDPATIDRGDLTVNGIPADGVALTDARTLTFHFLTSPVTSQGVQTMAMAAGSVQRLDDGDGLDDFTGQFRYDAVLLQVASTTPAVGSVVPLPLTKLRLTFNEAYAPASIGTNDLGLSQGTVTGFTLVSPTAVEYQVSGIAQEGTLTVTMAAGAVTDAFGNPGGAFTGTYTLDVGTVPFPTPVAATPPAGSLIYDTSKSGVIGTAGDTDRFTLLVDPGQKITVTVDPDAALRPAVDLYRVDSGGPVLVGTASAGSSGKEAVLQTVATHGQIGSNGAGPKTYIAAVRGAGGTTGGYAVRLILNAAVEGELHDGAPDNTRATAQVLDPAFLPLNSSVTQVQTSPYPGRGAVLGRTEVAIATVFSADFESGDQGFTVDNGPPSDFYRPGLWHRSEGRGAQPGHSATHSFYYGHDEGPDGGGSINIGSFNPTTGGITSPSIALPTGGTLLLDFNYVLQTRVFPNFVDFATVQINDGSGWTDLRRFDRVAESTSWRASDPIDLTAYAGSNVRLRWTFDTRQGPVGRFPEGWYVDDVRIRQFAPSPDYYAFSLQAGESATLALAGLSAGDVALAVEDSKGATLAIGSAGANNLSSVIPNFVATATGTYYARVTGTNRDGTDYGLVVTRDALFNVELNDSIATAQNLGSDKVSGQRWVLGSVSSGADLFDLHGTPVSGPLVLASDKVTLGINSDGSYIVGPTGIQFLGNEFVVPGTPLAGFTIGRDGANFTNKGAIGTTDIVVTKEDLSSGSFHGVRIVGIVGGNLQLERVVAFRDGDEFATVATRLTNLGTSTVTNVAWLENLDPDQAQPFTGDFSTSNDVVLGGQLVRASAFPPDFPGGLTIGLGSADPRRVVSADGFDVRDPFQIINAPQDPNGSFGDIAINLAFNYGNLAPSQSAAGIMVMTFGRRTADADATYQAHAQATLPSDRDFYRITTDANQMIEISTATPAGADGEFVNGLDPMVRLYNAAGTVVASDDNSAADRRNASLRYKVPKGAGGTYYVEVLASPATAQPTRGEYILSVKQTNGTATPFRVEATDPADGSRLRGAPTTVRVDFSNTFLLTSLQASDLKVDGVPASSLTVLDGDTALFTVPAPLGEGTHTLQVAAGAIQDTVNTPIQPFTGSFYVDVTPPRIVGISLQEGDTAPAGDLAYTVLFSEAMRAANLDNSDFSLFGNLRGTFYTPDSAGFDSAGTTLTLHYAGLPDDEYTLTLFSGDGRFEDLVGFDLDGESVAFPIPPNRTGDGVEGGDFSVHFGLDTGTVAYPTPLTPKGPQGGLIYDPTASAAIAPAGDTDSFTINIDAGQTLTVTVAPSFSLQPNVEVRDPGGALIGTASASAPGAPDAIIQTVHATSTGIYTITVGGAAGTTGLFTVQATLNAAVERESAGGPDDGTLAGAQYLDPSFTDLLKGATRGAVLGRTDPMGTYTASAVPFAFEDISATGHAILQGSDFDWAYLSPSDLDGFHFTLNGMTATDIYVSADGFIPMFAPQGSTYIYPMYRDLMVQGSPDSAVYWEVIGEGDDRRLVVQWNAVGFGGYPDADPITFEAILSEADGSVRFNYLDLATNHEELNEGLNAWAVGFSSSNFATGSFPSVFLPTFDAPNQFVGTGRSTRIALPPPPPDLYAFTLSAGQGVSVAASGLGGSGRVELLDPDGNLLATSSATAGGLDFGSGFAGASPDLTLNGSSSVVGAHLRLINFFDEAGSAFSHDPVDVSRFSTHFRFQLSPGTFPMADGITFTLQRAGSTALGFGGSGLGYQGIAPGVAVKFDNFDFEDGAFPSSETGLYTNGDYPGHPSIDLLPSGIDLQSGHEFLVTISYDGATLSVTITDSATNATATQTYQVDIPGVLGGSTAYVGFTGGSGYLFANEDILDWTFGQPALQAIDNYTAPASGTYYVRVTGDADRDYGVVVTRDAVFDLGRNDTLATAQPLGALHVALGRVGGVDDASDVYSFAATAGTPIHLFTTTPADGPGEFGNELNPHLRLFDAFGALVAEGVPTADGRNEEIVVSDVATGTYYVEITAEGGTSGEYILDPSPVATAPDPTGFTAASSGSTANTSVSPGVAFAIPITTARADDEGTLATVTSLRSSGAPPMTSIGAISPVASASATGLGSDRLAVVRVTLRGTAPASLPIRTNARTHAAVASRPSDWTKVALPDEASLDTPKGPSPSRRARPGSSDLDATRPGDTGLIEERGALTGNPSGINIEPVPGAGDLSGGEGSWYEAWDSCLDDTGWAAALAEPGQPALMGLTLGTASLLALASKRARVRPEEERQARRRSPLRLRPHRA